VRLAATANGKMQSAGLTTGEMQGKSAGVAVRGWVNYWP